MSLSGPCLTQCLALMNSSLQIDCLGSCGDPSLRNDPREDVPMYPDDVTEQSYLGCMTRGRVIMAGGLQDAEAEELIPLPHEMRADIPRCQGGFWIQSLVRV